MSPESQTKPPNKRRRALFLTSVGLFLLALCIFSAFLVSQTDWIPQTVDMIRGMPMVGPERVATMENVFFTAQDSFNQFVYDHTHPAIALADPKKGTLPNGGVGVHDLATPTTASEPEAATSTPGAGPTPVRRVGSAPVAPQPILPIIISDFLPGEGIWSSDGMPSGDRRQPPLLHTTFRPDPERPYAHVELVWIDMGQTKLDLVPGTVEPHPMDGIRGAGQIPIDVQSNGKLLAAWNGGFLTIHGAYGMMVNRRLISSPRDGFATLAQYSDGTCRLGIWGQDISMTPDLVSFRENGPILVERGVVNQDSMLSWGKSVSGSTNIWRSGIGLTADGALIYAIGNALSAQTLGEALARAGAVEAMQLDVNSWHVYFFTYRQATNGVEAAKLSPAIPGASNIYLKPYQRDFMYLSLK